jgi:hypothetical protein
MTRAILECPKRIAFLALMLLFLFTVVAYAADPPFAGKWKGETRVVAAPAGAPVGGVVGAPAGAGAGRGGGAAAAPAGAGAGRGGGGGRGGFGGGGGGGSTKVALNLKVNKENKVSGNVTFGEQETSDVKEGKIEGNILTFKAGRTSSQMTEYKAELKENEIILTQVGGRGRQEWILTKK